MIAAAYRAPQVPTNSSTVASVAAMRAEMMARTS